MKLHPMLSSLGHHKLTVALLVLQVAFTCAIVCNATFLIAQRVQRISVVSGVDEDALSVVTVSDLQAGDNPLGVHQADLAALRRLPGVESASMVSNVPLSGDQNSFGGCGSLEAVHAAMAARSTEVPGCASPDDYEVGTEALRTLGLKLVAGRDFDAGDYVPGTSGDDLPAVPAIIITRDLARRLYGDGPAVGRSMYLGRRGLQGEGVRVVGVVEHLLRGSLVRGAGNDQSLLAPVEPGHASVRFVLRSKPADRARVIEAARAMLATRVAGRTVPDRDSQPYTRIRAEYFQRDITMIGLLLASALGLLFVTALGIAGLANFWVQQRTRTIGIRRAIGATRGDILRYFQTENFLIVSGGIAFGLLLAVALNLWLMERYELSRLPLFYLPIGALAMWLLGQLAVLSPALRAAAVPPVVATRSV